MLKSRSGNIAIILLFVLFCMTIFFKLPFSSRLAIYIAYFILLGYGSFRISSNFYLRTFCKQSKNKNQISITFDDGPHPENTPKILSILAQYNIKATFFLIGKNAEKYPELVKQIVAEGHLIGNHTYNHKPSIGFNSTKKVLNELEKTESVLFDLVGLKVRLFRPPFGITNPNIAKAVNLKKYLTIGWSLRSLDTQIKDGKKLLQRLTSKLISGDIILFHDYAVSIVNTLEDFIKHAHSKGLEFKRLDDFLEIEGYE